MKVKVFQNKINSVLSVVVSTSDWSRHELDSIIRFGEPEIQIGGIFRKRCPDCDALGDFEDEYDSNDMSENPECFFEITEQEKLVRSELPIMMEFPEEDFEDPEICAKSWSDEIVKRIATAVTKLRTQNANLVKEETYEF